MGTLEEEMIKAKRCKKCGKIIRGYNQSGYCYYHYQKYNDKLQRIKRKNNIK